MFFLSRKKLRNKKWNTPSCSTSVRIKSSSEILVLSASTFEQRNSSSNKSNAPWIRSSFPRRFGAQFQRGLRVTTGIPRRLLELLRFPLGCDHDGRADGLGGPFADIRFRVENRHENGLEKLLYMLEEEGGAIVAQLLEHADRGVAFVLDAFGRRQRVEARLLHHVFHIVRGVGAAPLGQFAHGLGGEFDDDEIGRHEHVAEEGGDAGDPRMTASNVQFDENG